MKRLSLAGASTLVAAGALHAQDPKPEQPADSARRLNAVTVTAERASEARTSPVMRLTLPAIATVTAKRVEETVNLVDAEDAVKYLPSVFLRKRNNGDTQATMGTRVWGVGSSARSLVFADGVPLTALVANNNTIGGPRWGLVSPAEIARIDMMYGPFSAAYAGNSMGAVMEITTRLPEKLEASLNQTQALQTFSLYGTKDTYSTAQTTAHVGHRFGRFSFWASGNYANNFTQPLSYVTSGTFPNGTAGAFAERNKLGAAAHVLGASGLLHTRMTNAKVKLAYDLTPTLRAAYALGYWRNDAASDAATYTRTTAGQPTFAGQAAFASGVYDLDQRQSAHSLSLRSDTKARWDFEVVATRYSFDKDQQRTPTTATTGTSFADAGRVAVLDGTGWATFDAKGIWRPGGRTSTHTVSFGAHVDRYELRNTTFNTADWRLGAPYTGIATQGDGKTRTQALWVQDAWLFRPTMRLTVGGRVEDYRGYDGYNVNGRSAVRQPELAFTRFSPKGVLTWTPTGDWTLNASVAKAYRFATASELYQLVSTGTTFTSPNPSLKPDDVIATELRAERKLGRATAQVALFHDDVRDAIISQFNTLVPGSPTLYQYVSNVDRVRARGAEVVLGSNGLVFGGLEVQLSATYLNARTVKTSGAATASGASANGKRLPNIPDWRASFVTTYRPDDRFAFTLAGRYSGKLYTTLDNSDVNPNTWQGFGEWFVADAHVNARVDRHLSVGAGVDNLLNRKYFLFHPFPQRTFVANVKVAY